MKIGLVVPGFSADAADWCIPALRHLARYLASTDQLRVIAMRYPYRRARYVVDGADVMALGGADRRGPSTLSTWRDALRILASEHRRAKFDVLHAFWATESGLLAAVAGRVLRVPTLVSLSGGELVALRDIGYGDQRVAWERLKVEGSLRLAAAVSAGSRLLMELAERHASADRLHRAPLGVDLTLFHPDRREQDLARRQRFLHVGTLTRVKDQSTLLRAFAVVRRQDPFTTLDVVGDGPLRSRLQQLAGELELGDAVRFHGEIDHGALPDVYREADAFVVSSRHEAQGMVALEAAACGLPIAGTRVGVIPELTTAVAPIRAPEALAAAMIAAHDGIAPLAVERIHNDFGLGVCTDRFRSLYADLIAI